MTVTVLVALLKRAWNVCGTALLPVLAVALPLAVLLGVSQCALHSTREDLTAARAEAGTLAIALDSVEAVADTTRRTLTDSLATAERRAVQSAQRSDSLARTISRLTARVAPARVEADGTTVVSPADSLTRMVDFTGRQVPFTVRGHVTVPPVPQKPRVVLSVTLDTIPMMIEGRCTESARGTLRSASVRVVTPSWVETDIVRSEWTPDVCNPPVMVPAEDRSFPWALTTTALAIGAAFGAILSN